MRQGRRRWHWFAVLAGVAVVALGVGSIWMSGGGAAPSAVHESGRRLVALDLPSPVSDIPSTASADHTESAAGTAAELRSSPPELPAAAAGEEPTVTASGASEADASGNLDTEATEFTGQWHVVEVASGDSLYSLFLDLQLSVADLARILGASPEAKTRLSRLRPGETLELDVDDRGRVQTLVYHFAAAESLRVERAKDQFHSQTVPRHPPVDEAPAAPDLALAGSDPLPGATPSPHPAEDRGSESLADPEAGSNEADAAAELDHPLERHLVTIKRGDSLYSIFLDAGLRPSELAQMLGAGPLAARLRRIQPGERLAFHLNGERSVEKLVYDRSATEALHVTRTADGYEIARVQAPIQRELANASGTIDSSLFLAGRAAGLSDRLVMELVDIFGWDVDFALDIRSGDRFSVIYEELYKDGLKLRDGAILAAEFVNRGRVLRAVRFIDPQGRAGYYSPEGFSMRKAFLRTPVKFGRISSRFSSARRHPVLHTIRAHRGVDYAAPRGTPILAAGDGKVTFVGPKGGYGKTVVLQHGSSYTTLYAHMSRFAKGIRKGRRVRQGQIIGYVGRTGLATGDHLHYEFRVRGVHRDPLKVKLPRALPIAPQYKAEFLAQSEDLVARLDALANTQLAVND